MRAPNPSAEGASVGRLLEFGERVSVKHWVDGPERLFSAGQSMRYPECWWQRCCREVPGGWSLCNTYRKDSALGSRATLSTLSVFCLLGVILAFFFCPTQGHAVAGQHHGHSLKGKWWTEALPARVGQAGRGWGQGVRLGLLPSSPDPHPGQGCRNPGHVEGVASVLLLGCVL